MTLLTTLFLLLVGAAAAFAVVQTLRTDMPRAHKAVFVAVRILIAGLIILAFLEPVLTLRRLPQRDRPLTLLVDASSSMSLFCSDSAMGGLLEYLEKAGEARGYKVPILFFGDSLREKNHALHYRAADRKSIFPSVNDAPALRSAARVLLVSDGNFSNSGPVDGAFAEKTVNFLTLGQPRNPASIVFDAPDTVMCTAGVRCSVSIGCSGYATVASVITIEATKNDQPVFTDTMQVDQGRFTSNARLHLPALTAGMHLFRITATNNRDSVFHRRFLMCRAVQSTFTYAIAAPSLSIDERFLRLTLAGMPAFRESEKQNGPREQVRFILHTSASPLPPASVLPVYIGCLPTVSAPLDSIAGERLFLPPETMSNPLDDVVLKDMPPIVPLKTPRSVKIGTTWLAARTAHGDTIPLLYSALFQRRAFIACAFDGIWKWDFLPMSHHQGEADKQTFSRCLLEITRAALLSASDDTAIVWPVGRMSSVSPLKFACIIPRNTPSDTAAYRIVCSLTGRPTAYRQDTTIAIASDGPFMHYFTMPSPEPGDYAISCTLSTPVRHNQSVVPFTVTSENPELLASGQNTALLREIGQPIDFGDTARMAMLFDNREGAAPAQPVEERYPVKRSWWILGALFALFGIEWVMRRTLHLD